MPIEIHGKQYVTVPERVNQLREAFPIDSGVGILTELLELDASRVLFKAEVIDAEGKTIGVGHAMEEFGTTQINQTSAVENCETSAIGRALAACGYGGTEYASANEVQNAIGQQVRQFPKVPSEAAKQRERVSNAPKQMPHAEEREEWHECELHFGKNKGKKLGELSELSLQWDQNNYEPSAEYDNQQDKHLRAMLDASMGKEVEKIETVEEPETEDIPF